MEYKSHGTFDDENNFQKEIAKSCNVIVEIGVMHGATSLLFLQSNLNCTVYGIDPLIPDSMNPLMVGDEDRLKMISNSFNNFVFIKDYSYNVVKDWKIEIDYIFIDGSHLYEDVKRDFTDWYPFIKKGGYISFHDSSASRGGPYYWEGPTKFVDELLMENSLEYVDTICSLTIFKKIN